MTQIKRILLDLDDVCNRFTLHLLHVKGLIANDQDERQFPRKFGFDLLAAANDLRKRQQLPTWGLKEFWDSVPMNFWATVPESEEFRPLLGHLESLVGRQNICILTSTTKDPGCLAGKLQWIQSHMPNWMHRQYLMGPRKWFCATPESLLIDDSSANVEAFRAKGGRAILVPRPWNCRFGWPVLPTIVNELGDLFCLRRNAYPVPCTPVTG